MCRKSMLSNNGSRTSTHRSITITTRKLLRCLTKNKMLSRQRDKRILKKLPRKLLLAKRTFHKTIQRGNSTPTIGWKRKLSMLKKYGAHTIRLKLISIRELKIISISRTLDCPPSKLNSWRSRREKLRG